MYKNMEEIMKDEEFLISLVETNSADEFYSILQSKKIELDGLTKEEAYELFKAQEFKELDENALDDVSGGIAVALAVSSAAYLLAGGSAICFFAGGAYETFRKKKKK